MRKEEYNFYFDWVYVILEVNCIFVSHLDFILSLIS